MPFVKRDDSGAILALYREKHEEGLEYQHPSDLDVASFLESDLDGDDDPLICHKRSLTQTDMDLIRAIEDLIRILLKRAVVLPSDFAPQLVELLEQREKLRRIVQELSDL